MLRHSGTIAAEAICEAVWSSGGEPLILHGPAHDPTAELPERLARLDGVLLPGGADVGPHRYGGQPHPSVTDVVDFQDDFEFGLVRVLLESDLPVLAICRGLQVLNIVLGGTLVPHLEDLDAIHRQARHDITPVPGTRLAHIVGDEPVSISSYHHQGVDRLGRDLTVSATAPDGLVEAVEHTTRDILAVQWHPEDYYAEPGQAHDRALFDDLVERSARHPSSS